MHSINPAVEAAGPSTNTPPTVLIGGVAEISGSVSPVSALQGMTPRKFYAAPGLHASDCLVLRIFTS